MQSASRQRVVQDWPNVGSGVHIAATHAKPPGQTRSLVHGSPGRIAIAHEPPTHRDPSVHCVVASHAAPSAAAVKQSPSANAQRVPAAQS
jgi:hypothetical protein